VTFFSPPNSRGSTCEAGKGSLFGVSAQSRAGPLHPADAWSRFASQGRTHVPIIRYGEPLTVLVAVKGHPFDRTAFAALFDEMEGM